VVAVLKRLAIALLLASPARADDTKSTANAEKGTSSAAISTAKDDEEGTPRFSLPTEADRVAWQKPGFRMGLGLGYGQFHGVGGAPSGRLIGAVLHAGLRLDRDWSIVSTFQYELASKHGGLSGLRFAGTVDPTWHVTPSLSLAIGVGFGGIVEGRTGRMDVDPLGSTLSSSYTFPNAKTPIPSCSGVGATALARGEYAWVLGPRSQTGVALEVMGQYTECVDSAGRLDVDTAQPIERHQYWPHVGAQLTWGVMWR
jgi:hypothetical protein